MRLRHISVEILGCVGSLVDIRVIKLGLWRLAIGNWLQIGSRCHWGIMLSAGSCNRSLPVSWHLWVAQRTLEMPWFRPRCLTVSYALSCDNTVLGVLSILRLELALKGRNCIFCWVAPRSSEGRIHDILSGRIYLQVRGWRDLIGHSCKTLLVFVSASPLIS